MNRIEQYIPGIKEVCQQFPVKRLGLFGSSLTNKFNDSSDVDVLVVFDEDENINHFNEYFDLKDALEGLLSRKVDLVVDKKFRNPIFQQEVDRTRLLIYEK